MNPDPTSSCASTSAHGSTRTAPRTRAPPVLDDLRAGLEPFARAVRNYSASWPDEYLISPETNLTLGDLRAAARLIAASDAPASSPPQPS